MHRFEAWWEKHRGDLPVSDTNHITVTEKQLKGWEAEAYYAGIEQATKELSRDGLLYFYVHQKLSEESFILVNRCRYIGLEEGVIIVEGGVMRRVPYGQIVQATSTEQAFDIIRRKFRRDCNIKLVED